MNSVIPKRKREREEALSGHVRRLLDPDVSVEIRIPRSSFGWSKTRRPTVTNPNALCDPIPQRNLAGTVVTIVSLGRVQRANYLLFWKLNGFRGQCRYIPIRDSWRFAKISSPKNILSYTNIGIPPWRISSER